MENQIANVQQPVTALSKFNGLLGTQGIKKKFEEVLGKKAPMFVSNLTTIMSGSPELQKCEHMSIISSALMAASMDLPLTPGLGFAGIVPYFDGKAQCMKAQFQVMKKGYIQLAQRTGQFKIINVSEVYEGELKSHNRFTGEYVFDENGKTSDKIIGYVSYFRLVNGFEKYLYMPIEKLDAHAKKYSKSFQRGTGKWADKQDGGYEQMCEKTVLKLNLSTYAPLSVDVNMMNAIIYDQAEIRDMDAKDYDYLDNDQAKAIEAKDVVEMGNGKQITIDQKADLRSERIAQSVSSHIEKANGKLPNTETAQEVIPEAEQIPPAEEVKQEWTEASLTEMGNMIYAFAEKNLPAAKFKMLESIPGKKSNKRFREALLAYQEGTIDKWLTDALKANQVNTDASQAETLPQQEKVVPEKSGEAVEGDLPWESKTGGVTTAEATKSFEAQRVIPQEQTDDESSDIPVISELNPANGKRAFGDAIKLTNFFKSNLGITDANINDYLKGTGLEFPSLGNFCERAEKSIVEMVIQKNL